MKSRRLCHVLLVCSCLGLILIGFENLAFCAETGKRMDLRQLWDQVKRRFPGLSAARHAVSAAKYQLDEQQWLRLPSGEFTTYLTWSPKIDCVPEKGFTAGTENVVAEGTKDRLLLGGQNQCLHTTATLNLLADDIRNYLPIHGALLRMDARVTVPIYTFGKISTAVELGKIGVDLAKANQEITQNDLALNTLRAYYGLKAARAALDTVKEGHEQVQTWLKRIDKDLEKGKGGYTEIDLMRLKVADSQVEMTEIDMDRTVKGTLRALRYLAQDDQADVDEGPLEVEDDETKDLSYYLDMALLHRPELKVLNATGRGAAAYRKLRIAELLPDLAAVVNFNYYYAGAVNDPNNAFMNRFNALGAGVGLALRLPLDIGPRVARLQKSMAEVKQYEAKRAELLGGGAVEIERAYLDLKEAQKRYVAAQQAERRARGWLQGVKQNIDVGTAESRDMIDALQAYFGHHLTVLRTINDVNTQAAWLRRLAGLPIIPEKQSEKQ